MKGRQESRRMQTLGRKSKITRGNLYGSACNASECNYERSGKSMVVDPKHPRCAER